VSALCGFIFLLLIGVVKSWSLRNVPVFVTIATVMIIVGWNRWQLEDHWQEMQKRQTKQEEERGGVLAGRELEWREAWNGILNSPLVGGGKIDKLSYYNAEKFWVSHSTYLDAGLVGGLPGMVLFIWFVFRPIGFLWNQKPETGVGSLLVVFATAIVLISYGSAMQVKFMWILWGIAAPYFVINPQRMKRVRRPAREQPEEVQAAL
jgi:O-antigen ligase